MADYPPYGPVESPDGSPAAEAREAMRLLMLLSERQRALVLCWFCSGCYRHVGPGDHCTCKRDD